MRLLLFLFQSLLFFIEGNRAEQEATKKCVSSCPKDWEKAENHCFFWPSAWEDWEEAEQYCKDKDGHLASVTTMGIHNYLWSKIKKNRHYHMCPEGVLN